MGTIEAWQVLAAVGLVLAIFEFFTTTFFSLPAGIAFCATAVFGLFIDDWTTLCLILAANLAIVYFVFHGYVWPRVRKNAAKTNADGMMGKIGLVSESVDPRTGSGYVKLYGDSWGVIANQPFSQGTRVKIIGTEGNKVVIRALEEGES